METIELEKREAVAWVWLNRPHRMNAMNQTLLAELRQVFQAIDEDEAVRAVVVAGRGHAFSAGFDVAWMAGLEASAFAREMGDIENVYDVVESCAQPVIVALHGAVMGGGLLLALVADLRLADQGASLGAPEVKIGIFPPLGLVPRLERIAGLGTAKRMVLTGEALDAAEAHRLGLVDRILPAGELYAEAQALAEQLAALPACAVQAAKAAFAAHSRADFVEWERARFAACWSRPERAAAMQAFLQARAG